MLIRVLDKANPLINDLFRLERERGYLLNSEIYAQLFITICLRNLHYWEMLRRKIPWWYLIWSSFKFVIKQLSLSNYLLDYFTLFLLFAYTLLCTYFVNRFSNSDPFYLIYKIYCIFWLKTKIVCKKKSTYITLFSFN